MSDTKFMYLLADMAPVLGQASGHIRGALGSVCFVEPSLWNTGCIEEFLKAENFFKNIKKKTNLISLFCTLKLASIFLTFLT